MFRRTLGGIEPERPTRFMDLQPAPPISCSSRCGPSRVPLSVSSERPVLRPSIFEMRLRRSPKPTDDPLNPRFSKSLFGVDGAVWVMAARNGESARACRYFAVLLRERMRADPPSRAFGRRIKLVFASRMEPLRWTKIGKVWRPCSGAIEGCWKGATDGFVYGTRKTQAPSRAGLFQPTPGAVDQGHPTRREMVANMV
jgi:hypothetical protein